MTISELKNVNQLKKVFSWLTKTGMGVKFGSRPIGWYQSHQCNALDVLLSMLEGHSDNCKVITKGCQWSNNRRIYVIDGQKWYIGNTTEVFEKADNKTRM